MANSTVRTQIYLEKEQHEALKRRAEEESVSMAHLIREAVTVYLADEQAFDEEAYRNDPIWDIPEMAEELGPAGVPNGSVDHDHYVYDLDKPGREREQK